jgi:hypothetical protein
MFLKEKKRKICIKILKLKIYEKISDLKKKFFFDEIKKKNSKKISKKNIKKIIKKFNLN